MDFGCPSFFYLRVVFFVSDIRQMVNGLSLCGMTGLIMNCNALGTSACSRQALKLTCSR